MKKIILSVSLFVAIASVSFAQTPAKKGGVKPTPATQQASPASTVAPASVVTPVPATATATENKPAATPSCQKKGSSCCKKKSN